MNRSRNSAKSLVPGLLLSLALWTPGVFAFVVVDNSPDTTGVTAETNNYNNLFGTQYLGDRFTLSSDTTVNGGAVFSSGYFGHVGDLVRFVILPDDGGVPGAEPVIDVLSVLDAVDDTLTASDTQMTRKHATIPPQWLPAGNYWFYMAGYDVQISQGTGDYDDNTFRAGFDDNPNLEAGAYPKGDVFFTIESEFVPVTQDELIADLVNTVDALKDREGISHALEEKLDNAQKILERAYTNNDGTAVNVLNAFIHHVNALRGKHLDETDADALIATTQAVINSLSE